MTIPTSYYATVRRNPYLVAFWRLNDKSGNRAIDWASKYELNGIYGGEPSPLGHGSLILSEEGGSAQFGLTEQNIEIPDANPLHIIGDITIEAWVVPYEKEKTGMVLSKLNPTGIPKFTFADPYSLEIFKGAPVFALGNGTNQKFIISPAQLPVGIPSHIVCSCFRKNMYIYVNGVQVITGSLGSQEVNFSATNTIYLGATGNNEKRFNGLIGEVSLYNGAISIKSIERHYNIGRQIVPNTSHIVTFDPPSYS